MSGNQPPIPMRKMFYTWSKNRLIFTLIASTTGAMSFYFYYVEPRFQMYRKFANNYDPYSHMEEICAYPVKYLHGCPQNLVKILEEKGYQVAPPGESAKTFSKMSKPSTINGGTQIDSA